MNWKSDESHAGRKVVVVSLRNRVSELRTQSQACRESYKQDFMRVPLTYLADALSDAADLLEAHLDHVIECAPFASPKATDGDQP